MLQTRLCFALLNSRPELFLPRLGVFIVQPRSCHSLCANWADIPSIRMQDRLFPPFVAWQRGKLSWKGKEHFDQQKRNPSDGGNGRTNTWTFWKENEAFKAQVWQKAELEVGSQNYKGSTWILICGTWGNFWKVSRSKSQQELRQKELL